MIFFKICDRPRFSVGIHPTLAGKLNPIFVDRVLDLLSSPRVCAFRQVSLGVLQGSRFIDPERAFQSTAWLGCVSSKALRFALWQNRGLGCIETESGAVMLEFILVWNLGLYPLSYCVWGQWCIRSYNSLFYPVTVLLGRNCSLFVSQECLIFEVR